MFRIDRVEKNIGHWFIVLVDRSQNYPSRGQGHFRDDHEQMEYMNILHIYDYTYVSAYTRWSDNFDYLIFIICR